MLRPVDIAVAFDAAMTDAQEGRWAAADVRHHLGIPRATLSKSFERLREARVFRGAFINRSVLAAMLPLMPSLAPIRRESDTLASGLVTGFAAPAFAGHFQGPSPLVWQVEGGPDHGVPIQPLHPSLPAHILAAGDESRHAMLAYLDAVRGGRAREVAHGIEGLRLLCNLPRSPGMGRHVAVGALMAAIVGRILGEDSGSLVTGAFVGAGVGAFAGQGID